MIWFVLFLLFAIVVFLLLLKQKQIPQIESHKEKEWIQETSSLEAQIEQLKQELANQKNIYEDQSKQNLEREKQNYSERLKEKEEYFEQIQEQNKKEFESKKNFYEEQINQKKLDLQRIEKKHQQEIEAKQDQFDKDLERERKDYNERLEEKEKHYEDREKYFNQLKAEFENISNKILKNKTENFQQESEKSLGNLLKPLKEEMKKFEERYNKESQERFSLKKEIDKIANKSDNLTQALQGDTKTQGDWGEVVLERILENSGLRKGKDFIVQGRGLNLKSETGQIQKPDVIINLPDKRWIVIDSKVSLTHYYNYTSAQSEEEKEECKKQIVKSLERHIENLSLKKYQRAAGLNTSDFKTPDFVLMFLPLEGALSLAIQSERYLFNKAWEKSIAIVSPITLYSTLKIINTLWKIDSQNKNARQIAVESGRLYDKFVGFVNDMKNIGGNLDKARESHEKAFRKLKKAPGNLIGKAEKLKELGAKTDKNLSVSVEEIDKPDKSVPVSVGGFDEDLKN